MMSDERSLRLFESTKKAGARAGVPKDFRAHAGYVYCGRCVLAGITCLIVAVLFIVGLSLAALAVVVVLPFDRLMHACRGNKLWVAGMTAGGAADQLHAHRSGHGRALHL